MNFLKHHAFALLWFFVLNSYTLRAQDFRILSDGVEYAQLTRQVRSYDTTAPLPCVVNLLRIDGTKAALQLVHSMDAAIGVETTSSLAKRYNALAATNAGFFRIGSIFAGDAAGVLQIDGKLLSEPHKERAACGIINRDDKSDIVFGHLKWKGETGSVCGFHREWNKKSAWQSGSIANGSENADRKWDSIPNGTRKPQCSGPRRRWRGGP